MSNSKNKIITFPHCLDIFILLPDQLFFTQYAIKCMFYAEYIYIVEAPEFFVGAVENKIQYIKHTMREYKKTLKEYFSKMDKEKNAIIPTIKYIKREQFTVASLEKKPCKKIGFRESRAKERETPSELDSFFELFKDIKSRIMMFQIADFHKFKYLCDKKTNGLYIKFFSSPAFLFDYQLLDKLKFPFDQKFTSFYKKGRKIFTEVINPKVDGKFKPIGGSYKIARISEKADASLENKAHNDAVMQIIKKFPTNHEDAKMQFCEFMKQNLEYYDGEHITSGISPALNCGLLTPHQILSYLINTFDDEIEKYEYFMRKIFLREFIHAIYYLHYDALIKIMKKKPNKKRISDDLIKEILKHVDKYSYMNNAGRKKILNQFITEQKDGKLIIDWFINNFLDGYEWAVLPIYGRISGRVNGVADVTQ